MDPVSKKGTKHITFSRKPQQILPIHDLPMIWDGLASLHVSYRALGVSRRPQHSPSLCLRLWAKPTLSGPALNELFMGQESKPTETLTHPPKSQELQGWVAGTVGPCTHTGHHR